jgi:hypothetical protein
MPFFQEICPLDTPGFSNTAFDKIPFVKHIQKYARCPANISFPFLSDFEGFREAAGSTLVLCMGSFFFARRSAIMGDSEYTCFKI